MGPATQVEEIALLVDADGFALGQVTNDFRFVGFALALKERNRVIPIPHLAGDGLATVDDLVHARFDTLEIFRGERVVSRKVVEEAVLDIGSDRHLSAGIELLDRFGEYMGRIMPQDIERRLFVLGGHDLDRRVFIDLTRQIPRRAVYANAQRRLGQPRPDTARNIGAGHRCVIVLDTPVGKGDRDHFVDLQFWNAERVRGRAGYFRRWPPKSRTRRVTRCPGRADRPPRLPRAFGPR